MTAPTTKNTLDATPYRNALLQHRMGHLAEAAILYRQVLAQQPDLVEAHVNLGSALQALGLPQEAAESFGHAIRLAPQMAAAHSNLAVTLFDLGRFRDSAEAAQRATELKPDFAQAFHNLGNALARLERYDDAQAAWRGAIALDPQYAEARLNLGMEMERRGETHLAEAAYRQALVARPGYPEAWNTLGILLFTAGRLDEAIAAYRQACELRPDFAVAYNNLGNALFKHGAGNAALAAFQRAITIEPAFVAAHNNMAHALRVGGALPEAIETYRRVLALQPASSDAEHNLGFLLCETGQTQAGFQILTESARRTFELAKPGLSSAHKLRHDREQSEYLGGADNAPLQLCNAERLAGPAIRPQACIEKQWRDASPQVVVIDNFLTADALASLRRFCLESTIWREDYENGYLGAFPEHGLACPLLSQIADELPTAYPAIFADHRLLQFWAFKYDATIAGIPLHADFAAVNVNFWITPDTANLDKEHGGLVIWDVAAPLDWDFVRYNRNPAAGREFLRRRGAGAITIPYRANRAVIFDSDLFHETDRIHFREGYANRRINLTLLYGRRGAPQTRG